MEIELKLIEFIERHNNSEIISFNKVSEEEKITMQQYFENILNDKYKCERLKVNYSSPNLMKVVLATCLAV
ncbi:MAG: hypothetical protein WC781_02215 [Candidatus Pacearchaeota archaeon]|jgi:hypothetical protein